MTATRRLVLVRLSSLEDLCRLVCTFDTTGIAYRSKVNGRQALVSFGEKTDGSTIAYFLESNNSEAYIVYELPSEGAQERAFFSKEAQQPEPRKCIIHVVDADLSSLAGSGSKRNKNEKINTIMFYSLLDLVKIATVKAVKDESVASLYSFSKGGQSFFAGFNFIDELADDSCTVCFAKGEEPKGPYIKYDYKADSLSFSNSADEPGYAYVKVIRLAEPLPFLASKL